MSKKISELDGLTIYVAEDIITMVDFDAPDTKKNVGVVVDDFFNIVPVDIGVDGHVYQNAPLSYAGKRIEIISPYTEKDNEYKGQLHCHTTNSDGADTPAAVVTAYRDAGYDFVSITDHDMVTADPGVLGILFLTGDEETGDLRHIGSINPTVDSALTDAQLLLDAIVADGAFPIMNHPNNPITPWTDEQLESLDGYMALEIFNAFGNRYSEDKWDTLLTKYVRAFGVATDDIHDIAHGAFATSWVIVFADSLSAAEIMDNLKRGNFYASSGPTLSVSVAKKVITAVTDSASTIEFIGNGGAVLQTTASVTTASYTVVGDEIYVRVKITRDADTKYAWSNPVYVYQMPTTSVSRAGLVKGNAYIRGNETIEGKLVIDVTDTEAVLVRKNADGGDVFVIDTTNSRVGVNIVPIHMFDVGGDIRSIVAGGTPRYYLNNGVKQWAMYQDANGNVAWNDGSGDVLTLQSTGDRAGFGISLPLGKVHIDQSVNDAAFPVLVLDQADISEGFINFIGSDRGVIGEGTNSTASVRVEIGGVVHRLALYADA